MVKYTFFFFFLLYNYNFFSWNHFKCLILGTHSVPLLVGCASFEHPCGLLLLIHWGLPCGQEAFSLELSSSTEPQGPINKVMQEKLIILLFWFLESLKNNHNKNIPHSFQVKLFFMEQCKAKSKLRSTVKYFTERKKN